MINAVWEIVYDQAQRKKEISVVTIVVLIITGECQVKRNISHISSSYSLAIKIC